MTPIRPWRTLQSRQLNERQCSLNNAYRLAGTACSTIRDFLGLAKLRIVNKVTYKSTLERLGEPKIAVKRIKQECWRLKTLFKLARLLSFTGPCCLPGVTSSEKLASCTWDINHSSAFCISKPVKGLSILSSSFTLELLTNLLIQATVLSKRLYLLNLEKSRNGGLGCTTQLTAALLFLSGSTISLEGFDLKSSAQSFSDSCNQMGPLHHKWLSLSWLADKPWVGGSAGFCSPRQNLQTLGSNNDWIPITRLATNGFHWEAAPLIQGVRLKNCPSNKKCD